MGAVDDVLAQVWREHWSRIVALLVAQLARPDLAEDAAADAFAAAARRWPDDGVPANPPAWLLTTARRRALDRLRAEAVHARRRPQMVVDARERALAEAAADPAARDEDAAQVPDERLQLVLACCHPAMAPDDRVALTLRFVVGLPTVQVARLLLVQESTMAARLTRAKRRLAGSGIRFGVPDRSRLPERLDVVATVLYLLFTAGYQPVDGPHGLRVDLADEAIRLTTTLLDLVPGSAVLRNLLALMRLQHSRRRARLDADGRIVLLPDQDRSLWDADDIAAGLALLAAPPGEEPSALAREYRLQALVAAEHATATEPGTTDWRRVADLYTELEALTGSPVVRVARAVAVAEAEGPDAGLALLADLDAPGRAPVRFHRLPAVRGQLLLRAGRAAEAVGALERAVALAPDGPERRHLAERLAEARAAAQPTGDHQADQDRSTSANASSSSP